jgi:hypothetical protein
MNGTVNEAASHLEIPRLLRSASGPADTVRRWASKAGSMDKACSTRTVAFLFQGEGVRARRRVSAREPVVSTLRVAMAEPL